MAKTIHRLPPAKRKRRRMLQRELPRGLWLAGGVVLVLAVIALGVACAFAAGVLAAP